MSGICIETAGLRDSGYRWLGAIPAHWTTAEIRRIADIRLGKMLQTAPTSPEDVEMPYVSAINVQPEGLSVEPKKSMWFSRAEQQELTIEPGDVLVVEGGSVGRSVYLADGLEGWRFQNSINRVRSKPALSVGAFVDYALRHLQSEGVIDMVCNKATIMHLTAEKLGRLRIALPSVNEQERIVSYLDQETAEIDDFIADQEELIGLLDERRAATITQAVTKGLDPTVTMKDSGSLWLGRVPEQWDAAPLKRYASVLDCKHITAEFSDAGEYPLASIQQVQSKFVDLSEAKRTTDAYYRLLIDGDRKPRTNDLIFSRNATVGQVAQVGHEQPEFAMGQDVCLIRGSDGAVVVEYLHYALRSSATQNQLESLMVGSTFRRINVGQIKTLLMAFPDVETQRSIVQYLDFEISEIDSAIEDAKKAIELSKERRAALISAAVTGKIDVRKQITAELGAA